MKARLIVLFALAQISAPAFPKQFSWRITYAFYEAGSGTARQAPADGVDARR